MKVYRLKSGRKFRIAQAAYPMTDGIVYFTQAEFIWMKDQNLSDFDKDALWELKSLDHQFQIVPDADLEKAAVPAIKIGTEIIESLKGRKNG